MQISSKQLVAGKLDWGWLQAIRTIIGTSLIAGCLVLLIAARSLLDIARPEILTATGFGMAIAFSLSGYIAKEILVNCRQNLPLSFSITTLTGLGLFGSLLLVAVSVKGQPEFGNSLVAGWWAIAAVIFIGISLWLAAWITQSKPINKQDLAAAEHLNIITYSDQTVVISPTPLSQHPRLFNGLILLILSALFWTMLTLPDRFREIVAIVLAISGLTSLNTWYLMFFPSQRLMRMSFSGILGLAANYTIKMQAFSRLEIIKLIEGDLTWVQLSGQNIDIALPSAVLRNSGKAGENDELSKALIDTCHLARHETSRDSLGLMGVLLPQGTIILAGSIFLSAGLMILLFLPLPPKSSLEGLLTLIGCVCLSAKLSRGVLSLVAPNSILPDRQASSSHLEAWEFGMALLITVIALQYHQGINLFPILFLAGAWLSFGVGACLISLVKSTPIQNKN